MPLGLYVLTNRRIFEDMKLYLGILVRSSYYFAYTTHVTNNDTSKELTTTYKIKKTRMPYEYVDFSPPSSTRLLIYRRRYAQINPSAPIGQHFSFFLFMRAIDTTGCGQKNYVDRK